MPKITFNISLSEDNDLKHLVDTGEYVDRSDAGRTIFRAGYRKLYPIYVKNAEKAIKRAERTPEEKAKEKIEVAGLTEKLKTEGSIERGRRICEALGGIVVMSDGGFPHCEYNMYSEEGGGRVEATAMKEPLDNLNEGMLHDQYKDLNWEKGEEVKKKLLALMAKNK